MIAVCRKLPHGDPDPQHVTRQRKRDHRLHEVFRQAAVQGDREVVEHRDKDASQENRQDRWSR